jgi:membrane protein required for colicin V production
MDISDFTIKGLLWTDWAIILFVVIFTLKSIRKGLLVESLSLGVVSLAVYVSANYNEVAASTFNRIFGGEFLTPAGAMSFGFMLLMLILSKFKKIILKKIKLHKITIVNHLLGSIFGFIKGVIFVSLILVFNGFSVLINGDAWKTTKITSNLQPVSDLLLQFVIPKNVEKIFKTQLDSLNENETFQVIKKDFNIALGWNLKVSDKKDVDKKDVDKKDVDKKSTDNTAQKKLSPAEQRFLKSNRKKTNFSTQFVTPTKSDRQILLNQLDQQNKNTEQEQNDQKK